MPPPDWRVSVETSTCALAIWMPCARASAISWGRASASTVRLDSLLAVSVTAASLDDGRAASDALGQLPEEAFPRLRLVWADQKYHNHGLYVWMDEYAHYQLEIVRRPEGAKGFVLLPKRWVVERTFAWLGRCRRLSVDRERTTLSSEAMIQMAMIHLMLNRLCPTGQDQAFRYRASA